MSQSKPRIVPQGRQSHLTEEHGELVTNLSGKIADLEALNHKYANAISEIEEKLECLQKSHKDDIRFLKNRVTDISCEGALRSDQNTLRDRIDADLHTLRDRQNSELEELVRLGGVVQLADEECAQNKMHVEELQRFRAMYEKSLSDIVNSGLLAWFRVYSPRIFEFLAAARDAQNQSVDARHGEGRLPAFHRVIGLSQESQTTEWPHTLDRSQFTTESATAQETQPRNLLKTYRDDRTADQSYTPGRSQVSSNYATVQESKRPSRVSDEGSRLPLPPPSMSVPKRLATRSARSHRRAPSRSTESDINQMEFSRDNRAQGSKTPQQESQPSSQRPLANTPRRRVPKYNKEAKRFARLFHSFNKEGKALGVKPKDSKHHHELVKKFLEQIDWEVSSWFQDQLLKMFPQQTKEVRMRLRNSDKRINIVVNGLAWKDVEQCVRMSDWSWMDS
ncbi:hypothetical protein MKZ38_007335 [Zalerion maritima]|uniref:Uncharacterized protein n=1 Tax=Zalerion maritima TaxID=339359 RepID=A0AAD5S313_9PEZI|nr:hypothetical protein MKZ38_007335 [Zalerion maritima]